MLINTDIQFIVTLPNNSGSHNFGFVGAAVVGSGNWMVVVSGNWMVVGFFGCVLVVLS